MDLTIQAKGAEATKPRTGAKVSPAVEPVYHAGARMKAAVRADDLETVEPIVGPDAQGHRRLLVFHRHTGAFRPLPANRSMGVNGAPSHTSYRKLKSAYPPPLLKKKW